MPVHQAKVAKSVAIKVHKNDSWQRSGNRVIPLITVLKQHQEVFSNSKYKFQNIFFKTHWVARGKMACPPLTQRTLLAWCWTIYLELPAQHLLRRTSHWIKSERFKRRRKKKKQSIGLQIWKLCFPQSCCDLKIANKLTTTYLEFSVSQSSSFLHESPRPAA